MFVSWDTIPLIVSKGFVQNYTVTYQSVTTCTHGVGGATVTLNTLQTVGREAKSIDKNLKRFLKEIYQM